MISDSIKYITYTLFIIYVKIQISTSLGKEVLKDSNQKKNLKKRLKIIMKPRNTYSLKKNTRLLKASKEIKLLEPPFS